jgi:hypothetical protein
LRIRSASTALAALTALAVLGLDAGAARALGPVNATLGIDYYHGPESQTTVRPMGECEAEVDSFSATVGASHFEDNQTGHAWGITATLKGLVAPRLRMVAAGTGFAGDSTHGAWRAKLGPEWTLAPERTIGVFAVHYDDRFGNRASGVETDFDTPLVPRLSGSMAVAVERSNGLTGEDATATLAWNLSDVFELTGDLGVSHNGSGLTGLLPPRGLLQKQQGGRSSGKGGGPPSTGTSTTATVTSATALIGVRVHF